MTLTGAIRYFLQSPHYTTNCFQHVHSGDQGPVMCISRETHQGAYQMQHVCHMVRRDSLVNKCDRVQIQLLSEAVEIVLVLASFL